MVKIRAFEKKHPVIFAHIIGFAIYFMIMPIISTIVNNQELVENIIFCPVFIVSAAIHINGFIRGFRLEEKKTIWSVIKSWIYISGVGAYSFAAIGSALVLLRGYL